MASGPFLSSAVIVSSYTGFPCFRRKLDSRADSCSQMYGPCSRTFCDDAGGRKQHVALAEQLLGAVAVENRARIDLRRHAEGDAGREVGLDQPGDDVHRRPLRREDQVDADGARHLRQARDRFFDFVAGDHHQVGQLVHDHDDERERPRRLAPRRLPCARASAARCGCTARCCGRRTRPASCSALPSRGPPSAARSPPSSDRRRPASSGAGCPRTSRAPAASDRS